MGITADRLLEEMSAEEFVEHWVEFQHDPWDQTRADLRSGMLASIIYNVNRKSGKPAMSAKDFILSRVLDTEESIRQHFIDAQKRRLKGAS